MDRILWLGLTVAGSTNQFKIDQSRYGKLVLGTKGAGYMYFVSLDCGPHLLPIHHSFHTKVNKETTPKVPCPSPGHCVMFNVVVSWLCIDCVCLTGPFHCRQRLGLHCPFDVSSISELEPSEQSRDLHFDYPTHS